MRPKYTCPDCPQQFSRQWKMRQHCKTQHKYDPSPKAPANQHSPNLKEAVSISKAIANSLQGKVRKTLRSQELSLGRPLGKETWNIVQSTDSTLAFIINNCVLVRKRTIQGISGHFCDNCLTFRFKYIMDIGHDLTPIEKHSCAADATRYGENIQNKDSERRRLRDKSFRLLVWLTGSVFGARMKVVSRSINPESPEFQFSPRLQLHILDSDHWISSVIRKGRLTVEQIGLPRILHSLTGTFAVISVETGQYQGYYFVKIIR